MLNKILIMKIKYLPSHLCNRFAFGLRGIIVGNKFCSYGRVFVRGRGRIQIGDNVTINSCRECNPIGGDTKTILYAKVNSVINIGNGVGISNSAIVSMKEIVIEDDVLIGGNCKIYDHDFHSIEYEKRILEGDLDIKSAPIHIKRGAFIGAHCIILKGVNIGEKSVIGAGSVVTKNVPDGEIWAGNPAKKIGRSFVESKRGKDE